MGSGDRRRAPLPAGLTSAEQDFFEELRRVAGMPGMSARGLERLTETAGTGVTYSKSQWARWLTGQGRPPVQAIRALAGQLAAAGIGGQLMELWAAAFAPVPAPRGGDPAPVRPCQLPPAAAYFTGRGAELAVLDQLAHLAAGSGGPLVISAIGGTAGVGKTALAVHWAHHAAGNFPDGQLYVNLRGFDPSGSPADPAEAIHGFLEALAPGQPVPAGLQARTGLYRSLLAGRRVLVVLDNARDAAQVRPLLPGTGGCLVLVTSRSELAGLAAADGARQLSLDVLEDAEARALLISRLGGARVTAEPGAVRDLIALCARLPLALNIAAARAAARPGLPLAALAADLRGQPRALDGLDTGDPASSARSVFSWSYRSLTGPAARLFRLLGVHPGPDITAAAATSLAGIPAGQVRELLAELTAAHLLAEHVPGRFAFHDLLRAYAAEQAETAGPGDEAAGGAVIRALDHYLHSALPAAALMCPGRDMLTLAPASAGVTPEEHDDAAAALAWFTAERQVIAAAVALAAGHEQGSRAWQLGWLLGRYLHRRGEWQEWAGILQIALAAAGMAGDLTGQAHARRDLGLACAGMGTCQDAAGHLQLAMDLYQQVGGTAGTVGQAHTHLYLGRVLEIQGADPALLLPHQQQALQLFREAGHRAGQANALGNAAQCYSKSGDYGQALTCCEQAIELHREIGNRDGEGHTWGCLGYTYCQLGDREQAVTCDRTSVAVFRELGDRPMLAESLTQLGGSLQAAGRQPEARAAWQEALGILEDLRHPDARQVRGRLAAQEPAAAR